MEVLVVAAQTLDRSLLFVDEIQQLLNRDLPIQRISAKLSEIDAYRQDAHDQQRQFAPAPRGDAGMAESKGQRGPYSAAPSFQFEQSW
jgi:hypothetical protein